MIIPANSIENMQGAVLDIPAHASAGGLVIRNPNTPNPLAGLDLQLEGELPQKVQAVLDGKPVPPTEDDADVIVTGVPAPARA